jgi:hypothetical protein
VNVQELLRGVTELMGNVLWFAASFVRRRALPLLVSTLAVLLAASIWNWYRAWLTHEIVLLAAPAGGAASSDAKKIAERIAEQSTWYGHRYLVRVENTEGYEENRRRVSRDQSGRMIGFAQDGFGEAENVRILCPLERNILHILCRRKFLDDVELHTPRTSGGTTRLRDIFNDSELLRPGRAYFGPPDSGTRQLATHVLRLYGKHGAMGRLQAPGIANWYDMRAAFNNDSIDLAFLNAPLGNSITENIAQDGSCVLLDLGPDRDALWQGLVHIQPDKLAANSYSNAGFCPNDIQTLATRRVVICSSTMSDPLAYFLAVQCHEALRDSVPFLTWEGATPLQTPSGALSYRLHPGAERLKEKTGAPWSPKLSYLWSILAVWLATEAVKYFNEKLKKRRASVSAPAMVEQSLYADMKQELEGMVRQLERMPLQLNRKELQTWVVKASDLRGRLLAAVEKKQIDEQQAHTLIEGVRRELEYEIAIRRARRPGRLESQAEGSGAPVHD